MAVQIHAAQTRYPDLLPASSVAWKTVASPGSVEASESIGRSASQGFMGESRPASRLRTPGPAGRHRLEFFRVFRLKRRTERALRKQISEPVLREKEVADIRDKEANHVARQMSHESSHTAATNTTIRNQNLLMALLETTKGTGLRAIDGDTTLASRQNSMKQFLLNTPGQSPRTRRESQPQTRRLKAQPTRPWISRCSLAAWTNVSAMTVPQSMALRHIMSSCCSIFSMYATPTRIPSLSYISDGDANVFVGDG